jgi:hypothetical protein
MGRDSVPPRPSNSGSQLPFRAGKHESAGVTAPKYGERLRPAVARQITASRSDAFNKFAGAHENYGRQSRKVPYLSGGSKKR